MTGAWGWLSLSYITEQVLRPTASRTDREVSGVEVNKSLPEPENKNGPGQHNKHLVLNYGDSSPVTTPKIIPERYPAEPS